MTHFLVLWHEDDHYELYGVFDSMDSVVASINKEDDLTKARLIINFRVQEMEGKEIIDVIYIEDLLDSIPTNPAVDRIIEEHNRAYSPKGDALSRW